MPTINATQTDLIELLAGLVKFPTYAKDHATCQAALDWIKHQLRHLPLRVHDYTYQGYPSVVFTTHQTRCPQVLLMAHVDVVQAPSTAFVLRRKQGRLYGRGVFDMKTVVAIYMKLLLELDARLPQYSLGVMLTTDEEISGEYGTGALVHAGWRAGVVVNPDAINDWQIERSAKGFLRYTIVSQGQAGHSSRPWLSRNAITELMAFLQELSGHFPAEPCGDPKHLHGTLNIGTITGGTAPNQIPAHAEADIDIRVLPGQGRSGWDALLEQVASHYDAVSIRGNMFGSPAELDPDNDYARLLALLITKIVGVQPAFTPSHGSSDSRFFAEQHIPVLVTGPPGGGHHSDTEWIDAKGVDQLYQIIRQFVEQVGRIS